VGYSGGQTLNPTYHNIKDHTEALLIEFDPSQITYEDLLIEWSRMAGGGSGSCQYRSAVWYLNDEQRESAQEVVDGMKAARGRRFGGAHPSVEKATRFYRGEEYHQDFLVKNGMGRR